MYGKGRKRSAVDVIVQARIPVLSVIALATGACQTGPARQSGFLTSYEGLGLPGGAMKKATYQHRDDPASDAIARVFIEPTVLSPDLETRLTPQEQSMVLREVDRQICFEVSERFAIADTPGADTGRVRTALVQLDSTSRAGSTASAAMGFLLPIPLVKIRLPGTGGGLTAESELLDPSGRQVAAVAVRRKAQIVGRTRPSLSRAGDALQLAEPLGDAIGAAFATKTRAKITLGSPDPCARFGPRRQIARSVGNAAVGFVTQMYVPQVAGTGARAGDADDPRVRAKDDPPPGADPKSVPD